MAGRTRRYKVVYAPEVSVHVAAIGAKYRQLVRDAVEGQLMFQPVVQTRNRQPLEDAPGPFGSTWELRCGPKNQFRVFYEVDVDEHVVSVLAIGVKDRDRLIIAGEEFVS